MKVFSNSSIFQRIKNGLKKTRNSIAGRLQNVLSGSSCIEEKLESIEEILIESDLGVDLSMNILSEMEKKSALLKKATSEELTDELSRILKKHFLDSDRDVVPAGQPSVIIFTGINGTGKTTSLAKIALHLLNSNKKVMLAACDTFRAAAIEQISLWGEKLDVNVVKGDYGSDAASVAFNAIDSAKAKGMDYLLIDTAGRLHNRKELMEELKKVIRICENKVSPKHMEKLFVMDGTTGQNGFHQAKAFFEAIGLDGIIITKLDGTAKGGMVIAIEDQLKIPVKFIGVGEEMEDLIAFVPDTFIEAVLK